VTVLGVPADAPPLPGAVVFDQRWCDLTFLHWPVAPETVARWMPPGARPDVVDGVTYVGLVPFQMRAARLGSRLPAPYLGSFAETNVRLYSVDGAGRHGVVFRSLDCSRLAVSAAARAVGVPYVWSHVVAEPYASRAREPFPQLPVGSVRRYATRRHRGGPTSEVHVSIGEMVEPSPLETFLTARWGMHSSLRGRPLWVPNQHDRWPLYEASVLRLDDELLGAAGVEPTGSMLRPLWSPGVRARFGRPQFG
jgi:uncharacterized protein YqjF (DUF2071 family)